MNLYKVETLVQFKHTYFIRAKELSHAFDEVVMEDTGGEAIQEFLGEVILGGVEVTKEEFNRTIESSEGNCSSWMGDKLIHTIPYSGQKQQSSSPAFANIVNTITSGAFDKKDTLTITPYSPPASFVFNTL